MSNWPLACSLSTTGEAKRYDTDHLGRRVTIFIRNDKKWGFVMRQTIGRRRVRLAYRFKKDPFSFNDWKPAVYGRKTLKSVKGDTGSINFNALRN